MREIIKQPFTNIESEWKKIKRVTQEAILVEGLIAEVINLVGERRKPKNKRRGNPQAAKHHNYLYREVKKKSKGG